MIAVDDGKLKQLLNNCFHSNPKPMGLQLPSLNKWGKSPHLKINSVKTFPFHTTQLQSYISFIFGNDSLDPLQVHTADLYIHVLQLIYCKAVKCAISCGLKYLAC